MSADNRQDVPSGNMPDTFDRMIGLLDGLTGVTQTAPSTKIVITPLVGNAETFIVHTARQAEVGDWVFLQHADKEGMTRIVIPPAVADTIARQREAVRKAAVRKAGRAQAPRLRQMHADRMARGEAPAFLKRKRGKKGGAK